MEPVQISVFEMTPKFEMGDYVIENKYIHHPIESLRGSVVGIRAVFEESVVFGLCPVKRITRHEIQYDVYDGYKIRRVTENQIVKADA